MTKVVCERCVSDPFLVKKIQNEGHIAHCDYCQSADKFCTEVKVLSLVVGRAILKNFYRTSSEPSSEELMMSKDADFDFDWVREGYPIYDLIQDSVGGSEALALDILDVLNRDYSDFDAAVCGEECEFDYESHYVERESTGQEWSLAWGELERSLKFSNHYFNQRAYRHFDAMFKGIQNFQTVGSHSPIVTVGPSEAITSFVRARVFNSFTEAKKNLLEPDITLGPPPPNLSSLGRMNARGISVFYGADSEDAAIAEVRPPVGSVVVLSQFDLLRPLRLLDLTQFSQITTAFQNTSIFDPNYSVLQEKVCFFRSFANKLSRPILPDQTDLDYIPMQALSDYLASNEFLELDGILFPSAQVETQAKNVILFNFSARVQPLSFLGIKVECVDIARYSSDPHDFEVVLDVRQHPSGPDGIKRDTIKNSNRIYDDRSPSLKINLDSIKILRVRAISFSSDETVVSSSRQVSLDGERYENKY